MSNLELVSRFFIPPEESFFLFGPRGTGKSTWIRKVLPHALTVDLLESDVFHDYHIHPEKLMEVVHAHPDKKDFLIDEVQKVPALLDVIHLLIEEKRQTRFALTGSCTRKLKRSGVNLLGGRALLCHMHPFMGAELGARFDLNKALTNGMLPLCWNSPDPIKKLKAYVSLYIREEVQMEGLIRRLEPFSRLLEAATFSHGQILNVSNVARDCGVNQKLAESHLKILEDLLLTFKVPVFTKRAKRRLIAHPKFYFFDAGVFRALRPSGPADQPGEIDGQALEGLVAQHLRAWIDYSGSDHSLSYWRTAGGIEADFVLYGPREFLAIEVKNSRYIRPDDLRGLRAFKEDYPEATTVLLYRGRERLNRNGVLLRPIDEFLKSLKPHSIPN
jgi:predicted AAA+ superfamily ATPase